MAAPGKFAKFLVKFGIVMILMTILCTIVWDFAIQGNLYSCSDAIGFDYLHPGDWIHGYHKSVPKIPLFSTMSDPDYIKSGWTIIGLWGLWFSFFATSTVASFVLAMKTWFPHPMMADENREEFRKQEVTR